MFTSKAAYLPEHPAAIAFYCSDGRFTEPVEELLKHLGHDRLDTITLPGGPGLLNPMTGSFGDLDSARRGSQFLITGHAITEAILVAHQGCGFYKKKFPSKTPEQVVALQLRDLRVAAEALRRTHGQLVTHMYFARPANGHVTFEPIT